MLVGHLAKLLLVCDPGAGWMLGAVNREKPTPGHSPPGSFRSAGQLARESRKAAWRPGFQAE
jgi:hypothetical protein